MPAFNGELRPQHLTVPCAVVKHECWFPKERYRAPMLGRTVVVVTGAIVVVVVPGDTVVVVGEPPIGNDPPLTVKVLKYSGPIGSKFLS